MLLFTHEDRKNYKKCTVVAKCERTLSMHLEVVFFHFAFGAVDALALDFTRYVFSALYGIILRFSSSMIHELDISVSKKPEV